jgi:hypothetical protein
VTGSDATVTNCHLSNNVADGINANPAGTATTLTVLNSVISANGGWGIEINNGLISGNTINGNNTGGTTGSIYFAGITSVRPSKRASPARLYLDGQQCVRGWGWLLTLGAHHNFHSAIPADQPGCMVTSSRSAVVVTGWKARLLYLSFSTAYCEVPATGFHCPPSR